MKRIEDLVVKAIITALPPVVTACKMFVPNRNNCFGKIMAIHLYIQLDA